MKNSRKHAAYAAVKRAGDVCLSLLGLIALSPLLLWIAAAVKIEDGGPVLFRQERITKVGRIFRILKFRTMRPEAYPGQPESERITRVGARLRRRWLDELPQLVNVLRGDMSLVGPRPLSLEDVAYAKTVCPDFFRREQVRAGLTGLAQLYGRPETPPNEKLAFDIRYIENQSSGLDLRILLSTLCKALSGSAVSISPGPGTEER